MTLGSSLISLGVVFLSRGNDPLVMILQNKEFTFAISYVAMKKKSLQIHVPRIVLLLSKIPFTQEEEVACNSFAK